MALNNTGNSVPSTAVPDFQDNVQVLDSLLNGDATEVTGRTGKELKSIAYLQNVLTSLDVGSFTFADTSTGLAGTTEGQYFRVPSLTGDFAFTYYLNTAGAAVVVARSIGNTALSDIKVTVQGIIVGIHALAESVATLKDAASDIVNLKAAVKAATDNTTAGIVGIHGLAEAVANLAQIVAQNLASDDTVTYDYGSFSTAGTVSATTGSTGTDSAYLRTDYIPVRKGDIVEAKIFTSSASAGGSGAIFDTDKNFITPLGIICAASAAYAPRYHKVEIAQDGYVMANTINSASASGNAVTGAYLKVSRKYRGDDLGSREVSLSKDDLIPTYLDVTSQTGSTKVTSDTVSWATGLYRCEGGRLNFTGLPIATAAGKNNSLFNISFFDETMELIAYRPVFQNAGYVIIPETAKYFSHQIITGQTEDWDGVAITYTNYIYKDELQKYLASLRLSLVLNMPNQYYLQDFSGTTDIEWIQNAVDWVNSAGGGILIISSDYVKSQFIIAEAVIHKSNVWIILDNVEVKLKDGVHDNLFRAAGIIVNEDDPFGLCSDLKVTSNIKLIGTGYSKVSGADVAYYSDIPAKTGARYWIGDEYGWRGTGLVYDGAQNFEIANIKLQNAKNWGTEFGYGAKNGYIHDIEIYQPNKNGDGIHFTNGASSMRVHNIFGYVVDDGLALVSSDDSLKYSTSNEPADGTIRQWIYPTCPFWYGWKGNSLGDDQSINNIVATNIGLSGKNQTNTILATEFEIYNFTLSGVSSVSVVTPGIGWAEMDGMIKMYASFGDASRYVANNIRDISINNILDGSSKTQGVYFGAATTGVLINRYMKLDSQVKNTTPVNIASVAQSGVTTSNING